MCPSDKPSNQSHDGRDRRPESLEPRPRPLKFILVFLGIALIAVLSALLGFLTMDFRFQAPDQEPDSMTPGDSSRIPEPVPARLFAGADLLTAAPTV